MQELNSFKDWDSARENLSQRRATRYLASTREPSIPTFNQAESHSHEVMHSRRLWCMLKDNEGPRVVMEVEHVNWEPGRHHVLRPLSST